MKTGKLTANLKVAIQKISDDTKAYIDDLIIRTIEDEKIEIDLKMKITILMLTTIIKIKKQ